MRRRTRVGVAAHHSTSGDRPVEWPTQAPGRAEFRDELDADPSTDNVDDAGPQALKERSMATDNSLSHTVRLATEPTQDVTVTITSADTGAVTAGAPPLVPAAGHLSNLSATTRP